MNIARHFLVTVLIVALVAFTGGCAVLTIDVDVYKGPLANHEHIQTQQLAVMAIAAKPLLTSLKDDLQGAEPYKELVERIDAILSLYDNQSPEELRVLVGAMGMALNDYKLAKAVFRPEGDDDDADAERWAHVSKSMVRRADDPLRRAYAALFTEREQDHRALHDEIIVKAAPAGTVWAEELIWAAHKKMQEGTGPAAHILTPRDDSRDWDGNYRFRDFLESPHLDEHVRWLFGVDLNADPTDLTKEQRSRRQAAEAFVAQVRRYATTFFQTRRAMANLLALAAEVIVVANTPDLLPSAQRAQIIAAASNVLAATSERVPPASFSRANGPAIGQVDGAALRQLSNSLTPTASARPRAPEDDRQHREAFARWIADAPGNDQADERARLIWNLHVTKMNTVDKGDWFGLARGPVVKTSELQFEPVLKANMGSLSEAAAHFEHGRVGPGLNDMIDAYIAAIHDDPQSLIARRRETQLHGALERFAAKMLFLVNHEVLLSDPARPGVIYNAISITSRTLLGDELVDEYSISPSLTEAHKLQRKAEQYVRILQAVGNSIVVQIDEIRHRTDHHNKLVAARDGEAAALMRAFSSDPATVIDEMLADIAAEPALALSDEAYTKQIAEAKAEIPAAQQAVTATKSTYERSASELEKAKQPAEAAARAAQAAARLPIVLNIDDAHSEAELNDIEAAVRAKIDRIRKEVTEDAKAKQLAAELAKAFAEAVAEFNADEARRKIAEALQAQYAKALERAEEPTTIAQAWTHIHDAVSEQISATKQIDASAQMALADAKAAADQAATRHADATKALAAITSRVNQLEKAQQQARRLRNARAIISDRTLLADVRTRLRGAGFVNPGIARTIDQLQLELRSRLERETAQDKQAQLRDALGFVNGYPLPAQPDFAALDGAQTAKDVMDQLIAVLRQRHLRAIADHGEGSAQVTRAAQALKAAYDARASMVYIRPPSAYLRSSYAATTLQGDPKLQWDNMLGEHGLRSFPFASGIRDLLNPDGKRDARITAEIDKQFWQNINRVRVAGGVDTNYVIVKDDIGNWYVKAYSANPERAIDATQSLLMYNLGAPASMIRPDPENGEPRPSTADSSSTTLGRLFASYEQQYVGRVTQLHEGLRTSLDADELTTAVTNAWGTLSITDEQQAALRTAIDKPSPRADLTEAKAALTDNATDEQRQTQLIDALQALRRFHGRLIAEIDALTGLDKKEQEALLASTEVLADHDKTIKDNEDELAELEKAPTPTEEQTQRMTALRGQITKLKADREEQVARQAEAQKSVEKAKAIKTEAKALATAQIRRFIVSYYDPARKALDDFEQSVLFITDAANQSAAASQ